MARGANSIDFWRGVALLTIFINHIPGNWFERFTHRNFGYSDSAELFVLLAGWSLRLMLTDAAPAESTARLVLRLGGRAITLYAAQIMITMIALAMIAATALWLANPLILDWHNAGAVFHTPVETHIGLVLLTHQLGYFDILPLYVVLIGLAPAVVLIDRLAPRLLAPLSITIYLAALTFQINAPTWPLPGEWYFNPFAWQFVYVLGFILGREAQTSRPLGRMLPILRWPALAFIIAIAWASRSDAFPDPTVVPWPTYLFIVDKSYATPLRIIHLVALCAAFVAVYSGIARYFGWLAGFGALLGRNSLHVFCVGSLLSLAGQLARAAFPASLMLDLAVVTVGAALMWATAWLTEARVRLRR